MSDGEVTNFGFRWGPMKIERIAHVEYRGYVIEIRTKGSKVYHQIYVSEKGKSVRFWRLDPLSPEGSRELK